MGYSSETAKRHRTVNRYSRRLVGCRSAAETKLWEKADGGYGVSDSTIPTEAEMDSQRGPILLHKKRRRNAGGHALVVLLTSAIALYST